MLYLVGTPIGNMGDLSPRASEILGSVDAVACEDTRRTGLLLSNAGIKAPKLISYYEQNKAAKGRLIANMLKEGADIALVSDAGMPSISDPGEDLVKLCIEEDLEFTTVPGPVAAITALVMSGLSTRTYHYEGFLPQEPKLRRKRLEALTSIDETIIIYEAPHRLQKLIDELISKGFGECRAAFCRELTKKYEQVIRLKVGEAKEYFENTPPKGEFVVCLEPLEKKEPGQEMTEEQIEEQILRMSREGMSTKDIAAKLSAETGRNKKEIYQTALNLLK